jgi:hypothetical protein
MRIFGRFLPFVLCGMLILGLTIPASAQLGGFGDLKLPSVEPPAWTVGQSATYKLSLGGIPDMPSDVTANIRMALVGKETVESQDYHWFELDISDMNGMPAEMGMPFKTVKVKLLMKKTATTAYQNDPKALLADAAAGKIIRKIVFQIDNQTPQMIDFMTIQGMVQGMTGQDLQSMVKDLKIDDKTKEAKADVQTKTGKETITVPAGTFTDAPFVWFKGKDKSGTAEGKVHAHSKVPLTAFVKMAMTVTDTSTKQPSNVKIGMELVKYEMSGATSKIVGEPVPFDMMSFMNGIGATENPNAPDETENPETHTK